MGLFSRKPRPKYLVHIEDNPLLNAWYVFIHENKLNGRIVASYLDFLPPPHENPLRSRAEAEAKATELIAGLESGSIAPEPKRTEIRYLV